MGLPTPLLPEGFATDSTYTAPGKDWDGADTKTTPSAGLMATGYVPEEERGADYDNYLFASLIAHAHAMLDIPIANWSFFPTDPDYSGNWYGVASDGQTWCLVGDGGKIQTSNDLLTWTPRTAGSAYADDFRAVCFGNGLFVAVGETGGIQTSPDGVTWTARTAASSYTGTFAAVIWSEVASLFIAVGAVGEIQTSPTGTTWTHRSAGSSYSGNFTDIAESGAEIVAIGSGSSNNVQRSTDGTSWTANSRAGTAIAYHAGAGLFVIGGNGSASMYTSANGAGSWVARTLPDSPAFTSHAIGYDGERSLVAVGYATAPNDGGAIYTSRDGITWKRREQPFAHAGTSVYEGIVFARERWVVAGPDGVLASLVAP